MFSKMNMGDDVMGDVKTHATRCRRSATWMDCRLSGWRAQMDGLQDASQFASSRVDSVRGTRWLGCNSTEYAGSYPLRSQISADS